MTNDNESRKTQKTQLDSLGFHINVGPSLGNQSQRHGQKQDC